MGTIYQSEAWEEVEKFELTDDFMISFFQRNPYGTIYVVDDERRLYGTIMLSDFRRYFMEKGVLIQTDYIAISLFEGEGQLQNLLQDNHIFAVPLLDSDFHIVKEYRKKYENSSLIDNDSLLKLYRHFTSLDSHVKKLVITQFQDQEQRDAAQKIEVETQRKLIIIDEKDIIDLYEYMRKEDYQIVYDCVPQCLRVREIIYIKLGVEYLFIKCPEVDARKEISGAKKSVPGKILWGGGRLAICKVC